MDLIINATNAMNTDKFLPLMSAQIYLKLHCGKQLHCQLYDWLLQLLLTGRLEHILVE